MLTMKEVQERLRVGRTTMRKLINEDPAFRTVKLGERRLMTESAYKKFIEEKEGAA